MADWTDIPDARLEPNKPIRSLEGLALRDNVTAALEGADGAPRLQQAAVSEITASSDNADTFLRKDDVQTTEEQIKVAGFIIGQTGTVNLSFDIASYSTTAIVRVYKNGSLIHQDTQTEGGGGFTNRSHNISVVTGDYIDLYLSVTGGDIASIRRIRLRATGVVTPWGMS